MLSSCLSVAGDSLQDKISYVRRIQTSLLCTWSLIALTVCVITGWMAFIGGRKEHYNDVNEDWRACLFEPNYVVLPVDELATTSPLAPILDALQVSVEDKSLNFGAFVNSLIYICCNTIAFTLIGQVVIYRSWNHVGWILPSGFFGLWCSLLSLTYYTASPPLPIPNATTSTIILLSYWLKKSVFDDMNDGDNVCGSAYYFVCIIIVLNVLMIAILGVGNMMAFSIEWARYKEVKSTSSPRPTLKGSTAVLLLTLTMMCCYVGEFLGRLVTSINSLNCLKSYDTNISDIIYQEGDSSMEIYYPDSYYPFQPGYINLTSLCWAVVFVSATRAYFGGRVAAYKTVAAASLTFALTNTSSMFYVMSLYYDLDLQKDSVCFDYFKEPENAALYVYPNDYQSKVYCQGTRVSTFLAVILYICMTIMFFLSSYLYITHADEEAKSEINQDLLGATGEYYDHRQGTLMKRPSV
mmetsp:Transcript_3798/g.5898  ORF Transcript_3798/g.5898 Transcript_3798/m.5898 type:complete len:466 (-) Transcript_3798:222-1619(-)